MEQYYLSRLSTPWKPFNSQFHLLYTPEFRQHVDKHQSLKPVRELHNQGAELGNLNRMLYVDTKSWLVDDLLLKADKMTMANSVELRVPLLDHKVMEFASSLPEDFKVRGFTTKYIAKKALSQRVPRAILQRRKTGFPVPYAQWLRNDLRSWMMDLLLDKATRERGYFRAKAIETMIKDDLRNEQYSKELFSLIVLELWHRRFIDGQANREHAIASQYYCAQA
jgi:asparagine synthase (glutamine-hydrolysing)